MADRVIMADHYGRSILVPKEFTRMFRRIYYAGTMHFSRIMSNDHHHFIIMVLYHFRYHNRNHYRVENSSRKNLSRGHYLPYYCFPLRAHFEIKINLCHSRKSTLT